MLERQPPVTIEPEEKKWSALLEEGVKAGWTAGAFFGVPSLEHARGEILEAAQAFTSELSIAARQLPSHLKDHTDWKVPVFSAAKPLIMSGHQPVTYHPGIIFKTEKLSGFASASGAGALNVLIDSDEEKAGEFKLPGWKDGQLFLAKPGIASDDSLVLSQKLVSASEIREKGEEYSRKFKENGFHKEAENLLKAFSVYESLSGQPVMLANSIVRWVFEGARGYMEVPLTSLLKTAAARAFTDKVFSNIELIHKLYNSSLTEFRAERKIKNPANPFPNLKSDETSMELPFWVFDRESGKRFPCIVQKNGDEVEISAGAQAAGIFKSGRFELKGGIELVPRGALITSLFRTLCCDFFIHGLGGAHYDAFTEGFVKAWTGFSPAPFVVVSKSRYLFEKEIERHEELIGWKGKIKDVVSHTDRYFGEGLFSDDLEYGLLSLDEKRKEIVREFSKTSDKIQMSVIGKELQAVNEQIKKEILSSDYFSQVNSYSPQEATLSAMYCREYPFFVFA